MLQDVPNSDEDDKESDIEAETEKVWSLGKSMGFLVNDVRELTKFLGTIKKRKNKHAKKAKGIKKGDQRLLA